MQQNLHHQAVVINSYWNSTFVCSHPFLIPVFILALLETIFFVLSLYTIQYTTMVPKSHFLGFVSHQHILGWEEDRGFSPLGSGWSLLLYMYKIVPRYNLDTHKCFSVCPNVPFSLVFLFSYIQKSLLTSQFCPNFSSPPPFFSKLFLPVFPLTLWNEFARLPLAQNLIFPPTLRIFKKIYMPVSTFQFWRALVLRQMISPIRRPNTNSQSLPSLPFTLKSKFLACLSVPFCSTCS